MADLEAAGTGSGGGGSAAGAPERVLLSVPARADFLTVLRLAATAVGSRCGLDVEEVDDVRIAVDEVAHLMMESEATGATLDVVFVVEPGTLTIEGRRTGFPAATALPSPSGLMEQILAHVVDALHFGAQDGDLVFTLSKGSAAEGPPVTA